MLGFLTELERQGFIERVSQPDSPWRAQERFLAAWLGQAGDHMSVLREARIVVAGLEPWGATIACELAVSGVGRLHLCDDGVVGEYDLLATRALSPDARGRPRPQALAETLGRRAPATELSFGSLDDLKLAQDGDCDLVVGALAPDEIGSWLTVARTCHQAGARSLSGCLQGREAVVGPLVTPGQTPCWNCFRLRRLANVPRPEDERTFQDAVLENPPPPHPRAYLAPMPPLVGELIALEVVKYLVGGMSPLVGRVLIYDLMSGESALHTLVRVPWCEVCAQSGPGSRGASPSPPLRGGLPIPLRGGGLPIEAGEPDEPRREAKGPNPDEAVEPGELRDLLAGWVDSRVGLVNRLIVSRPKADEPQLPFFSWAILSAFSESRHRGWQPRHGFGKGVTKVEAALSAVGEAIERYSACQWPAAVHRAPLAALEGDVLDPRDLALYADEQYARPGFPYARFDSERAIDWVRGRWLDDGSPVWVPALAAYLHYPARPAETFCGVTSNGLAAGGSAANAELRATLELLERDSLMLAWLSRSPPRPLSVDHSLDDAAAEALRQLKRYAPELEFYLLDCEVPVSVVACLSVGDGERWPGVAVGLGADLSPTAAVRKAILEQAQVGLSLRRAMRVGNVEVPGSAKEIRSELDHMNYYVPAERADALAFWRTSVREPVELRSLAEPEANSLSTLRSLLQESALRIALADVTAPDVAESPFRVARALAPGVQQIHFGFGEAQLGNPRLRARAVGGLNPDPHPLG